MPNEIDNTQTTLKQKNEVIARMIGWKIVTNGFYHQWEKPNGEKIACFKSLHFDTDLNWQYEAIKCLKKFEFYMIIACNMVLIKDAYQRDTVIIRGKDNEQEMIFKALYQFAIIKKEDRLPKTYSTI